VKKTWTKVLVCILLCLSYDMVSTAEETDGLVSKDQSLTLETRWSWQKDFDGWKYVDTVGAFKRNTWEHINDSWYYFDNDGYMATDWKTIKGMDYIFSETGEQETGWCYNEDEEKWHYYEKDGKAIKGWFQDVDGSWYWFSTKGEMVSSGYKNISGNRYYFFDNGQMASNQYVGLAYMDEKGVRNRDLDISVKAKKSSYSMPAEVKEAFTESSKNIPRQWVKKFTDQGWQVLYYPDKRYFSAPMTGSGIYYVCHKLDINYKKIKICNPSELAEAFGEYIGYASGSYKSNNKAATDLMMYRDSVDEFVNVPDYFSDDMTFYFGKLVGAYVESPYTRSEMEAAAPEAISILKSILYGQEKNQ
jgi:hypothetical protein